MSNFERYIEARVKGQIHGQRTINIFHFGTSAGIPNQEQLILFLQQLGQDIIECAIQQLLGAVTSDWTLEGVDLQQLHPQLTDPVEFAAPANSVGLRAPVNTSFECVIMRKKTGFGGKRKRGRNFLPPPGDADITNSLISSDPVSDFLAGFIVCMTNKFVGADATTTSRMVLLSPKTLKENPGNYNLATTDIAQLSIDTAITHMHSRKVGVGG